MIRFVDAHVNVGLAERCLSLMGGGLLLAYGLKRLNGFAGLTAATLGAGLIYRGSTGHSMLYDQLDVRTADPDRSQPGVSATRGLLVHRTIRIQKSPEEVYALWRHAEHMTKFLRHVDAIEMPEEAKMVWRASGPLGVPLTWEAEITEDRPAERLAWRSLPGGDVQNEGFVQLQAIPHGRGTLATVTIKYDPPGGSTVAKLADFLHQGLEHRLDGDLRRLKQLAETGEVATTEGQPRGGRQSRLPQIISR